VVKIFVLVGVVLFSKRCGSKHITNRQLFRFCCYAKPCVCLLLATSGRFITVHRRLILLDRVPRRECRYSYVDTLSLIFDLFCEEVVLQQLQISNKFV